VDKLAINYDRRSGHNVVGHDLLNIFNLFRRYIHAFIFRDFLDRLCGSKTRRLTVGHRDNFNVSVDMAVTPETSLNRVNLHARRVVIHVIARQQCS